MPRQGSRNYSYGIYLCTEVQLSHLYKTMSCKVQVAARRARIDVVRVAAGALDASGVSINKGVVGLFFVLRLIPPSEGSQKL